jgi:hypothetical protein
MLMKCMFGALFFGSLFWCPSGVCAALLLGIWAISIAAFACSNMAERFLWIPPLLALTGMFGLVLVLAIPNRVMVAAEEAMLIMFVALLGLLRKRSHPSASWRD